MMMIELYFFLPLDSGGGDDAMLIEFWIREQRRRGVGWMRRGRKGKGAMRFTDLAQ